MCLLGPTSCATAAVREEALALGVFCACEVCVVKTTGVLPGWGVACCVCIYYSAVALRCTTATAKGRALCSRAKKHAQLRSCWL